MGQDLDVNFWNRDGELVEGETVTLANLEKCVDSMKHLFTDYEGGSMSITPPEENGANEASG